MKLNEASRQKEDIAQAPRLLGDLLRERRRERGISQRMLAEHAEVRPSVVSRAERGLDCKLTTWVKLFDGLSFDVDLRLEDTGEEVLDVFADEMWERRVRKREALESGRGRRD